MTRLLIAASAYSLSESQFDGFITRHVALVRRLMLEPGLEVCLLSLGSDPDWTKRGDLQAAASITAFPWQDAPTTYFGRIGTITRRLLRLESRSQERRLAVVVRELRPDVAITLGPWFDTQYQAVFELCPTLHFFEEDVAVLFTRWWAGWLFHRLDMATRWTLRTQPRHVVVISDMERTRARRRYRGAAVTTIPYSPPLADWPLADGPSDGDDVLVMGALWQDRNALGLIALLTVLRDRRVDHIPFRLVSDEGIHPGLEPFLALAWVTHETSMAPSRANYDRAKIVVVPARRATGVKTTILQGWACGVAVAAYRESALTVTSDDNLSVASADTPEELADRIVALWQDATVRRRLATAGLAELRQTFDERVNHAQVLKLLCQLSEPR